MFTTPRSPCWLMAKGFEEEARDILKPVGTDHDDLDSEISDIKTSLDMAHHTLDEKFFSRKYSKPEHYQTNSKFY